MSSKSAVKLVVAGDGSDALFRWVAILTAKNALKGVGFFVGGLLPTLAGFQSALMLFVLVGRGSSSSPTMMRGALGRGRRRRSSPTCSRTPAPSTCSPPPAWCSSPPATSGSSSGCPSSSAPGGLEFLGGGRLPRRVVICYGPSRRRRPLLRRRAGGDRAASATRLAFLLAGPPGGIAVRPPVGGGAVPVVVVGLVMRGVVFALNSAVHSFLILHYAEGDRWR